MPSPARHSVVEVIEVSGGHWRGARKNDDVRRHGLTRPTGPSAVSACVTSVRDPPRGLLPRRTPVAHLRSPWRTKSLSDDRAMAKPGGVASVTFASADPHAQCQSGLRTHPYLHSAGDLPTQILRDLVEDAQVTCACRGVANRRE